VVRSSLGGRAAAALAEESAVVAAAQAGDEAAFAALSERYRRELQVHCYRLLGSFEEAEDVTQETFLRAWRSRKSFQGRSSFRAWLYRIATNACLDALAHRSRRVLPPQVREAADPTVAPLPAADLPWLEPYPDRLLEGIAPSADEPEAAVVAKETIELAFLAAIQYLPPRQRAVVILRDVLGWSGKETASLLEASVASVKSALQRGRSTLRKHLPAHRLEWARSADASEEERALLQRYMEVHERADAGALAELLRDDARLAMPPTPTWFDGREAIVTFHAQQVFVPDAAMRFAPTAANRQPALAIYLRSPEDAEYRPLVIDVLRIEGGLITDITAFLRPELFPVFGLPRVI
jgi:RNA polymerase sigma-70 factor, ECF subfamily